MRASCPWVVRIVLLVAMMSCDSRDSSTAPTRPEQRLATERLSGEATRQIETRGSASKDPSSISPGKLRVANVTTSYAVVIPSNAMTKAVFNFARQKAAAVKQVGFTLQVEKMLTSDYADRSSVEFVSSKMIAADAKKFRAAKSVIKVFTSGTAVVDAARTAAQVAQDTAVHCKGWVLDLQTLTAHTAAEFEQRIPRTPVDPRKTIMVHYGEPAETGITADTMGMTRFGLPELTIHNVTPIRIHEAIGLVNAIAQALLDGVDVDIDGQLNVDLVKYGGDSGFAAKSTMVLLRRSEFPHEYPSGHSLDDRFVEIVPLTGSSPTAVVALLDQVYGSKPGSFEYIPSEDLRRTEIAGKARTAVRGLLEGFAGKIPFGETLSIKARFADQDSTEYMWIDVTGVKDQTLTGLLNNTPHLNKTLTYGQQVEVKFDDIVDYIHRRANGTEVGGESTRQ